MLQQKLVLFSLVTVVVLQSAFFCITFMPPSQSSSELTTPNPHTRKIRLILLGDSITEHSTSPHTSGFGGLLQNYFCRTGDLFNRGYGGYNSKWILEGLGSILNSIPGTVGGYRYNVITVFLGANDSADDREAFDDHGQRVEVKEYKRNLLSILKTLTSTYTSPSTSASPPIIFLITPPPADPIQWHNRNMERTKTYADVVRDIVSSNSGTGESGITKNLHLIDLWSHSDGIAPIDHLSKDDLRDGLHLGSNGNAIVYNKILYVLKKEYKHLCVEDDERGVPMYERHLPYWRELAVLEEGGSGQLLKEWRFKE